MRSLFLSGCPQASAAERTCCAASSSRPSGFVPYAPKQISSSRDRKRLSRSTTLTEPPQLSPGGRGEAPPGDEAPEVCIRRFPPAGVAEQPCGPMRFQIPSEDADKPKNILEEIIWWKNTEVREMRDRIPLPRVQAMLRIAPPPRDFIGALSEAHQRTGRPGLIAEVKKASPSRGLLKPDFDPVKIAQAYEAGGAACLSVLTDNRYFQGSFENISLIRQAGISLPILCKEFIVEAYQLFRARAAGADAVLLIAAVLPNLDLAYLIKAATKLGLQCLVEVHSIAEMERVLRLELAGSMLGINNRNLETFKVDLENNRRIMSSTAGHEAAARGILVAGESGIFTAEHVRFVNDAGCRAVLVGESLIVQADCAEAVRQLLA